MQGCDVKLSESLVISSGSEAKSLRGRPEVARSRTRPRKKTLRNQAVRTRKQLSMATVYRDSARRSWGKSKLCAFHCTRYTQSFCCVQLAPYKLVANKQIIHTNKRWDFLSCVLATGGCVCPRPVCRQSGSGMPCGRDSSGLRHAEHCSRNEPVRNSLR